MWILQDFARLLRFREHLIHIIENAQSELTVFENAVLSKSISNLILQDNYSEAIFIIKRIANLPNLLNGMGHVCV
jgi:hypothetical protein